MRRILIGLACSFSVLPACTDNGSGTESDSSTTNNVTGEQTTGTNPTGSTTEPGTTGTPGTTGDTPTTDGTGTGPGTTGGGGDSKMEVFGQPCMTDADCTGALGPEGKCLKDILGVYALPGGYCSLLCMLPDANTAYVKDDPTCSAGGPGSYCIGADGYFEGCVVECTDNSQCPRDGYECRIMPQLGKDGDPKFCLMTDDNML